MHYSIENYKRIIQTLLEENYSFCDFFSIGTREEKFKVVVRHDIDFSPQMALELAKIENDIGITTTYSVLLRSQIYNALSFWTKDIIDQIHNLGHQIILHYSVIRDIPPKEQLADFVRKDFDIFIKEFHYAQKAFAWHTPPEYFRNDGYDQCEAEGLVNVCSSKFVKAVSYFSDSNLRHSVPKFIEIIKSKHSHLHLLFHPLNWIGGGDSMIEILAKAWKYIIRERELEAQKNKEYTITFPGGMPSEILENFAAEFAKRR